MESPLSKKYLKRLYDPEICHNKAQELIGTISRDEWEAWVQSNCTQALLLSLEGDIAGIVALWANGAYADQDNVEGTAQLNAKALGMMEAISGVSEHIRTMLDEEQTEDVYSGY